MYSQHLPEFTCVFFCLLSSFLFLIEEHLLTFPLTLQVC